MRAGIQKAIYWTPAQALEFARSDDPDKTFDQFIKGGQGGGGAAVGSGGGSQSYPVPPGHENDPDGSVYNNGQFIKRGNQIVPNAGSAPANP